MLVRKRIRLDCLSCCVTKACHKRDMLPESALGSFEIVDLLCFTAFLS